jgi:hypothetical protein
LAAGAALAPPGSIDPNSLPLEVGAHHAIVLGHHQSEQD